MMTTHTMTQLHQLKLGGMVTALQTQLEQVGTYEPLPFIERLGLLLEQENLGREQRKQERLQLKGESMRKQMANLTDGEHLG